jgi:hypothetical protein
MAVTPNPPAPDDGVRSKPDRAGGAQCERASWRGGVWTEERSDGRERASWRGGVWTEERSDGRERGSWRGGVWTEERSDEGRRREQRRATERARE